MSISPLCSLLLTVCGALPTGSSPRAPVDVGEALTMLTAPSAEQRAEAQAELTRLLRLSDLDLVTRAVLDSAEPELRWRLAEAVAGDGRAEAERLELASLLAGADPREGPRAVGRQALESLCLAWLPEAREELEGRGRTEEKLAESSLLRWSFDPQATLGPAAARALPKSFYAESLLVQAVDMLARQCGENVLFVITPEAAQIARDFERALAGMGPIAEDPERFSGSCTELFGVLSERYGLELEGHGIDRRGAPIVLLRERREATVDRTMQSLLVRWVRLLQEPESSPEVRRDAARALAASGWPAAIEWLTWRAFERSDAAAFDGVLLSAGRGLAVPRLLSAGGQKRLLSLLGKPGSPKARVARALGVFPGVDARGRDLSPALFESYAELDATGRLARLIAAELRSARSQLAVDAALGELLAGRASEAPLHALQALRTLAALGLQRLPEECELPLEGLLRALSSEPSGPADLAALGVDFGLDPPLELKSLTDLPEVDAARLFEAWVGWLFAAEKTSVAAITDRLTELPSAPEDPWGVVLRNQVTLGRGKLALELTLDLADRARGGGDEDLAQRLERSILDAGIADRDQAVRLGNALLRAVSSAGGLLSLPPEDLAAVGTLVAGPLGREATEALADLVREAAGLGEAQQQALVRAAHRARSEFLSKGLESRAQALNTSLRLASGAGRHPLRRAFRAPLWPPPQVPQAIPLEALERRFP